jgi:hypothetical protein
MGEPAGRSQAAWAGVGDSKLTGRRAAKLQGQCARPGRCMRDRLLHSKRGPGALLSECRGHSDSLEKARRVWHRAASDFERLVENAAVHCPQRY